MGEDLKPGLNAALAETGPGAPPADDAEQLELLEALPLGPSRDQLGQTVEGRRGPGRPAGARNRATEEWRAYLLGRYRSPLEALCQAYSRPAGELAKELGCELVEAFRLQVAAAKEAAPYLHQKQPQALEIDGRGAMGLRLVIGGEVARMLAVHGGPGVIEGDLAKLLEGHASAELIESETAEKTEG